MICECGGRLKVTHSFDAGRAKTATAQCLRCPKKYTLVTVIASEVHEHGNGATALARRLKNGETFFIEGQIKKAQPNSVGN